MTREEKKCHLAETMDIRPSTASITVDMFEQQKMFIAAIARNEYNKGVTNVLEIIDEVRNDESLLGHSRQDDFDLLRMKVKELMEGDEYNAIMTAVKALKALESLESEYKAYHATLYPTGQDSDYWRGVRYALDMLGGEG